MNQTKPVGYAPAICVLLQLMDDLAAPNNLTVSDLNVFRNTVYNRLLIWLCACFLRLGFCSTFRDHLQLTSRSLFEVSFRKPGSIITLQSLSKDNWNGNEIYWDDSKAFDVYEGNWTPEVHFFSLKMVVWTFGIDNEASSRFGNSQRQSGIWTRAWRIKELCR